MVEDLLLDRIDLALLLLRILLTAGDERTD
jgi:hypothetical protein